MSFASRFLFACVLAAAPSAAFAQPVQPGVGAKAKVSVKIQADVAVAGKAKATAGDAAYAAGNFEAALVAYGEGFAATRDAAFVYAMARCHEAAGRATEAKAMFQMYLGASGSATLKYKGDAETAIGAGAKAGAGAASGAAGKVGALGGKVKDTAVTGVSAVGGGVYAAVKISVAAQVSAKGKAEAKAADTAYAAGKFQEAAKSYAEAYAKTQQSVALYAAAQAHAQAGDAISARALLHGYLAAQPKGAYAKDAATLLLALGGNASATAQVSVKAKAGTAAKAKAGVGDAAMKSGKYIDAAKAYGEAHAVDDANATLLYARGMAELYAGATAAAAETLKAYLAAGGSLEFKVQAEAALRATGKASS
ncbi:MAG TPA: hypothetical protein VM261_27820 [Kofleriaceae bacterium]|nr:hypothetical protein [Kofleriaceae bacterium]